METVKRAVSLLLCFVMVVGLLPLSAFAATGDDALTTALTEATAYIDALTVNNSANDPSEVVANHGTHFTWDNEKREKSQLYLYDWSYYNGVVFEGLQYLYEVTGKEAYKNYVIEYLSTMIDANGDWAVCANNSEMTAAGYVDHHGADCYKTASMLLDAYELTGDDRYANMAEELYLDLDEAAGKYLLDEAGNNYRHTWGAESTYDLWLDGLYMILPFRAEYAAYTGDTAELKLIVDRLTWVSENMYNDDGLFYHAANNAADNSGTYWLRSIGWYAAAIADVMDSVSDSDRKILAAQLVKLADGLWDRQGDNGMWLNDLAANESDNNPYETSGTALVCYAVLKAVNNGWIEEAYADMAIKGFVGICENKLENNNLTDICFKGVPGGSNSTYYDNEGKGVGPFIMLTAEAMKYADEHPVVSEPVEVELVDIRVAYTRETLLGAELKLNVYAVYSDGSEVLLSEDQYTVEGYNPNKTGAQAVFVTYDRFTHAFNVVTLDAGVTVVGNGLSGLTAADVTEDETVEAAMAAVETNGFVAYDFTANTNAAVVSVPVPSEWTEGKLVAYYIDENGKIAETIPAEYANGKAVFEVEHFSTYAVSNEPMVTAEIGSNTGTGNLVGGKVYTLDTDGINAGENYLIVNTGSSGTGYALNNSGASATVAISDGKITVSDDAAIAWQFSNTSSGTVYNEDSNTYIRLGSSSVVGNNRTLTFSNQGSGVYRIYYRSSSPGSNNTYYYLSYSDNNWERSTSSSNVYLYEYTSSSAGEAVTFTVTPASGNIKPGDELTLNGVVTVGGEPVALSDCTITWASSEEDYATVSNGTVTGVADGTTNVTATLSAVDGTALQENIVLTIPVTVASKSVVSGVLSGNTPVTTKLNVEPDFSNIKLTVTYDDGTTGVITKDNGLIITGHDVSKIGFSYATISYGGKDYGTVRVTVDGNPYEGRDEATDYPEYPADGAVRINKHATELDFATTGLVNVELDVAGVSVKSAVDVILVSDLSNSMARPTTDSNGDGVINDNDCPSDYALTKLYDLAQSVSSFADIFLTVDEKGTASQNTMSLVTFGGFDKDYTNTGYTGTYADVTQTLLLGSNDPDAVKTAIGDIRLLKDSNYSGGFKLSFDGGETYSGNYGNTNYDYAFMETAAAIAALKAAYETANDGASYDESGRQIYVLFMTDGAPSNYNGTYYSSKTDTTRPDVQARWINDEGERVAYTMMGTSNAGTWYNFIAGGSYNADTDSIPGNPLYWAEQVDAIPGVVEIINVGFDLDHGGFSSMTFTMADNRPLSKVLENLIDGKTLDVYSADDKEGLSKIYSDLATELRYAGTSAQTTDIIDPDFTLQMGNFTGTADKGIGVVNIADKGYTPTITIKTYDLVTKADLGNEVVVDGLPTVVTKNMVGQTYTVDGKELEIKETHVGTTILLDNQTVTVTEAHLGMRKNTAPTAIETVTFNADGTEAYIRTGSGTDDDPYVYSKNIMTTDADGYVTIAATYFTYTKTPEGVETFKWNIGNITDKEIALSYYAYLKGSLEGEEADGLKYTNEEAILEYIDINGDYATQTFPVPAVAWGGASTAYEFYLVNHAGQPCDRNGNVIPFANRIIITGPYYEELYLNQDDENKATEIIAAYVLPAGYTLYDETAMYTVQTASGDNVGYLDIPDPGYGLIAKDETYTGQRYSKIENADGTVTFVADNNGAYKKITAQTTLPVSVVTPSYIQSHVAFGVIYNMIPTESEFTIAPDQVVIDYGKSIEINVNDNNTEVPTGTTATLIGFSKFYENVDPETQFSNTSSLPVYEGTYGTFTINADNNVLYTPHKFVNSVGKIFCHYRITTTGNDTYYMVSELDVIPATIMYYETDFATGVFTEEGTWTTETKGNAADGPQNEGTIGQNTYGFDTSYNNDDYLSNGSSKFVLGAIDDNGKYLTTTSFSFTGTGFDLISRTGENQGLIKVQVATDSAMTNIVKTISVLNKSESQLELYQIPVVSINGLDHSTYYVKISVDTSFVNDTDIPALDALARGNEFYFDAIRIYDPAQGNTIAEAAYNADGEANNSLDEVRALLLNAETYATITGTTTGMVFVDNVNAGTDAEGASGNVEVSTYKTIGPNNEVYLSKGQAVAFKVDTNSIPASFDIGAKSIEGNIAGLQVTVIKNDRTTVAWTDTATIASSTVQYIDLLDADDADASVLYQGAYVVITNTADGVLSITDLKTAFSVAAAAQTEQLNSDLTRLSGVSLMSEAAQIEAYDPFAVSYTVDAATFDVARAVLTAPAEPEVPETPDEPEIPDEPVVDTSMYNILSASVKANGSFKSRKYTITVVTSQMVEDILVMHEGSELAVSKITSKDKKTDIREWTIVLTAKGLEQYNSFTLTGVGSDGLMGEAFEVSTSSNHGRNDK